MTSLQLSKTEPEKQKQKLSKQLEQEQNHRNGDHMGGYQWGGGGERMGEKVQGCLLYTSDAADEPCGV